MRIQRGVVHSGNRRCKPTLERETGSSPENRSSDGSPRKNNRGGILRVCDASEPCPRFYQASIGSAPTRTSPLNPSTRFEAKSSRRLTEFESSAPPADPSTKKPSDRNHSLSPSKIDYWFNV